MSNFRFNNGMDQLEERNTCYSSEEQQKAIIDAIEDRRIKTFLIYDEGYKGDVRHFMAETCNRTVPDILRWIFDKGSPGVAFDLSVYVTIVGQIHVFRSSILDVQNHYDVDECVSVIFEMLLQRIQNFLDPNFKLEDCRIIRLRLQVNRIHIDSETESYKPPLPLPLRHNAARGNDLTSESELASLYATYEEYRRVCFRYFRPNMEVNFFEVQQCQTTKEVNMVPLLNSEMQQQQPRRNYLIMYNIKGEFQCLHELKNPVVFNGSDHPRELHCRRCGVHFKRRSQLLIHQQLRCGQFFTKQRIHPEAIEVYKNLLPVARSIDHYACYGVVQHEEVPI